MKIPVLKSQIFTGFLGFLVAIQSFQDIYMKYVVEDQILQYIGTNKFSQDHLENFFSCIRSRGGFNKNPTAKDFHNAYRKILMLKKIKSSNGNCQSDDIEIMDVFNDLDDRELDEPSIQLIACEEDDVSVDCVDDFFEINFDLTDYKSNVVEYIAGFVQKSMVTKVNCQFCKSILKSSTHSFFDLINKKQYVNGNLFKPHEDLFKICVISEKFFVQQSYVNKKDLSYLILKILKFLPNSLFSCLQEHILDYDIFENHRYLLMKLIIRKYLEIRIHHFNKLENINFKKTPMRRKLNNLIKFRHE